MEICFEDVSYTPRVSGKKLLHDVNGRFMPGQLTAIMGPSGAGKTTLLNAVSGYRQSGVKGGLVAGIRNSSCYIAQEDVINPHFSVGELMTFAGRLKLPATYSCTKREKVVVGLLTTLGLIDCFNTKANRLSGGQRKRLSIALELVNEPPVMFLDEPTSGLDIVSANQLIQLLSELSRKGKTIVCTIHQPSTSILELFDRVYILAAGRCVYQGGPGIHLVRFIDHHGFVCPKHYNPADYVLEMTEDSRNIDVMSKTTRNGKNSWFSKTIDESFFPNLEKIEIVCFPKCVLPEKMPVLKQNANNVTSFFTQFCVIFSRLILQEKRNKAVLILQFIHHILGGLIIGIIFYKRMNEGIHFQVQLKLAGCLAVFHSYTQQMTPIVYYPFEVKLLHKEHFNRWYDLLPYYIAFGLAKAPCLPQDTKKDELLKIVHNNVFIAASGKIAFPIFLNLLHSSIVYYMTGIPFDPARFGLFYTVSLLTMFTAQPIGLTIGALFSFTTGSMLSPMVLGIFLSMAIYGYDFMKMIPPFLDMVIRSSYIRATTISYMFTFYGLERPPLECPDSSDLCIFKDPRTVFHFLNLESVSILRPLVELAMSSCVCWLAFYVALKWKMKT